MSADSVLARFISDRDLVLDAIEKGFQVERPESLQGASLTGTEADRSTLVAEATVLRLLALAIAREQSVEVAAEPEAVMLGLPRSAARAMLQQALTSNAWAEAEVDTEAADVLLDALGWPA